MKACLAEAQQKRKTRCSRGTNVPVECSYTTLKDILVLQYCPSALDSISSSSSCVKKKRTSSVCVFVCTARSLFLLRFFLSIVLRKWRTFVHLCTHIFVLVSVGMRLPLFSLFFPSNCRSMSHRRAEMLWAIRKGRRTTSHKGESHRWRFA